LPDTRLLERATALEAEKAAITLKLEPAASKDPAVPAIANDETTQIKSDLAEALRSNGTLKSRVAAAEKELGGLRVKTKADTKLIEDLIRERAVLSQKVRDRDEELQGKAKFLVVLNLIVYGQNKC
jgi:chromosome segregation ATPase